MDNWHGEAPCGCRFDTAEIDGVRTFIVTACPAGEACTYVQFVFAELERQEKPGVVIDARG